LLPIISSVVCYLFSDGNNLELFSDGGNYYWHYCNYNYPAARPRARVRVRARARRRAGVVGGCAGAVGILLLF
jgi:hypothetical protein